MVYVIIFYGFLWGFFMVLCLWFFHFFFFFEEAGHIQVEGKFGMFCGTDLIHSHHCEDPRYVITNLISFLLLHASSSLWNGLSLTTSFLTPQVAES